MLNEIKNLLLSRPNIKAREIAKKIGAERKKVSAFLHLHSDDFIQDSAYDWSLNKNDVLEIKLQGSTWINCSLFESILSTSGSPLDLDTKSIVFIVPRKCKILLDAAARLLALCNQLSSEGKDVTIDFSDCGNALHYFDRIGYFEHLDQNVCVRPSRPAVSKSATHKGNNQSVLEFGGIDPSKSNKALIDQLTDCFVGLSGDSYEAAASTVFGELINNVQDHSQSKLDGFAALQKYGGKRSHIQIVVSDSGLGLVATLKPSIKNYYPTLYENREDDDYDMIIVESVMTKGEISRYGAGRGLGFKSSREQSTKFNAHLSIRQENFSLRFEYEGGELVHVDKQSGLVTLKGTHLCFDFFID